MPSPEQREDPLATTTPAETLSHAQLADACSQALVALLTIRMSWSDLFSDSLRQQLDEAVDAQLKCLRAVSEHSVVQVAQAAEAASQGALGQLPLRPRLPLLMRIAQAWKVLRGHGPCAHGLHLRK